MTTSLHVLHYHTATTLLLRDPNQHNSNLGNTSALHFTIPFVSAWQGRKGFECYPNMPK
jgi:hypothetical protein